MKLKFRIGGGDSYCQFDPVVTRNKSGNTLYPEGTCPFYRQFPNGNDPICLLFPKDERTPAKLEIVGLGFTHRLPQCREAEKLSGEEGFVIKEVVAAKETCELVPIIKKDKEPDPWISYTSGHETLHFPDQVCRGYTSFPNGSTWCRFFTAQTDNGQHLHRGTDGFTKRCGACKSAEVFSDDP